MFNREIIWQEIHDLDLVCEDEGVIDTIIADATDLVFADEYLAASLMNTIDQAIFEQDLPGLDDDDL